MKHKKHVTVRAHRRARPNPAAATAAVPVVVTRGPVAPDDPTGGLRQPAIGLAKRGRPALGPADYDDGYQR